MWWWSVYARDIFLLLHIQHFSRVVPGVCLGTIHSHVVLTSTGMTIVCRHSPEMMRRGARPPSRNWKSQLPVAIKANLIFQFFSLGGGTHW